MRGKILAASLAVLVGVSSVGCKTTSNMAWWKSAGKDAPEAEVLAHSAPELPSEIAKQVEGLAAGTTEQLVGGQAAPFVPSVSTPPATSVAATTPPGAYPTTEAPSYTPSAPQVAAVPAAPATANLGSIAMPYNPNAVPPAVASTPVETPASVDRYASVTPTPSSSTPPVAAYPSTTASPSYSQQVASAPAAATSEPPVTPTTASSEITATLGNRYAQAAAEAVPSASIPVENSLATPATQAPTVVAEASPYRPGGTSSYPAVEGSQSPVQVATRPETPATGSGQTTNTASPYGGSSLPTTPTVPQVPRYR